MPGADVVARLRAVIVPQGRRGGGRGGLVQMPARLPLLPGRERAQVFATSRRALDVVP